MPWLAYLQSLAGGILIGLAADLFLLLNGRIAGISGILGGLLNPSGPESRTNLAFVIGLVLGPLLFSLVAGHRPAITITAGFGAIIPGGLLVGFGTRLGSGCTSGHGVCGLARFSPRSMVAVALFLSAAILVVFVTRHLLSGSLS